MEPLGVRWTVGVDGISLLMVALTALLIPIGLLASANISRAKSFIAWMLLLEAGLIGCSSPSTSSCSSSSSRSCWSRCTS